MALLTPVQAKLTGTALVMGAAAGGGDTIHAGEHTAVIVTNGGVGSITVTVVVPGNTDHGQAEPDVPVTVAAGATKILGPFDADLEDPTDGLIDITYSGVTSVTVGAITV